MIILRCLPSCAVLASVFALSACGSIFDGPVQKLNIQTLGAEHARCLITTDYVRYVAYPPDTIHIRRMQEPLRITCQASGNREKTVIVHALMNHAAMGNVANLATGALVDQATGALYEYPTQVKVDFTHIKARGHDLPEYHSPSTVSPFEQVNEDRRIGNSIENPEDQGLVKSTPKPATTYSKEKPSEPPRAEPSGIERPY